jgi:hypothetical protein
MVENLLSIKYEGRQLNPPQDIFESQAYSILVEIEHIYTDP